MAINSYKLQSETPTLKGVNSPF